jgi:hypothetical protein
MHTFLSSLTAAMLLLHAFVGCCRHAAHDASCRETSNSASCAARAADCCRHGHQDADHEDQTPTTPCKCRLDCKSLCNYLPTEKVTLDSSQLVLAFDCALCEAAWTDAWLAATQSNGSPVCDIGTLAPPLRLHLLYQILLI